ncbi:uncharacterized protein F4817DRAFT_315530 [Daldinia loculata]|uniref:uncharacterized protein n=1 Tax=Daldinia loculata TaxID=103429 RepID=UPI0020C44766|nr:uncharacterized protein F4817DRAFT_315530 [Daldinia loculata]KAI1647663.1 hypothetical protein F4817DRAFT_315530 [Daldinia loculata]
MSIPLDELDRAEGGYGNERGKPSLEYGEESTNTEVEEQEPFMSLSKQNTSTLESQETSVDSSSKLCLLMKLGRGIGIFIGVVLVLTIVVAVIATIMAVMSQLILALWKKMGLVPS